MVNHSSKKPIAENADELFVPEDMAPDPLEAFQSPLLDAMDIEFDESSEGNSPAPAKQPLTPRQMVAAVEALTPEMVQ